MTEEEAKQQAWELVNQFVIACGEIGDRALSECQMQKASILVDWVADALVGASRPKVIKKERPPFVFDDEVQ